jgi:hypothetical protein
MQGGWSFFVPEGHPKIARQFIAGIPSVIKVKQKSGKFSLFFVPEGHPKIARQ